MSEDFDKFKRYYEDRRWNEERMRNIVSVGAITEHEFEQIVGKKYEE